MTTDRATQNYNAAVTRKRGRKNNRRVKYWFHMVDKYRMLEWKRCWQRWDL